MYIISHEEPQQTRLGICMGETREALLELRDNFFI